MAFSFRYLTLIFAGICFGAVPTVAQSQPGQVQIRFTVFSAKLPEGICFIPAKTKEPVELRFFRSQKSSEYGYTGGSVLNFFHKNNPGASVASLAIPAGAKKLLLLFMPGQPPVGGGTAPFEVIAVDDSMERIPPQHFAFLNLSTRAYRAHYGPASFDAPLGVSATFAADNEKYLKLAANISGREVSVGGLSFGLRSDQRAIVVIFPPVQKTGLQPLIRVLSEEQLGSADGKR